MIRIFEWARIGIARTKFVVRAFAIAALFMSCAAHAVTFIAPLPGSDTQSAYVGAFFPLVVGAWRAC